MLLIRVSRKLLFIFPTTIVGRCRSSVAILAVLGLGASATVLALVAGYVLLALGGGLLDEGELTVGEAGGQHGVNVEDYLGATACGGHVVDVGLGLALHFQLEGAQSGYLGRVAVHQRAQDALGEVYQHAGDFALRVGRAVHLFGQFHRGVG